MTIMDQFCGNGSKDPQFRRTGLSLDRKRSWSGPETWFRANGFDLEAQVDCRSNRKDNVVSDSSVADSESGV